MEVSDDNFAISLPTRLVSVAALLRRYLPSPHPLLRLLSHIPALTYSNQSSCRTKLTTLHDLCSGGPSRLLGNPNRTPQKYIVWLQGRFFSQHGVALALSKEDMPSPPSQTFALSYLLLPGIAWALPSKFACTLQFFNFERLHRTFILITCSYLSSFLAISVF